MKKSWQKEAVVYQIYPMSFMDSNNDGIGDINGIISRLDYLKDLGISVIWLSPIYMSGGADNGYDISDYRQIDPKFGTMEDFKNLLSEAHKRGLKLIMDGVYNHSSDEHRWFIEAKKSKDNPYRDYYIWHDGKNGNVPSNWQSFFSGTTWKYSEETGQYYLHLFTEKQPDLNWENPKLRQEIYEIMRFWMDMGIDGFRLDVINLIKKEEGFPNIKENTRSSANECYINRPGVHDFLQEMNREVLAHYDCISVGETPDVTPEIAALYTGEDRNELNMIFQFEHVNLGGGSSKWERGKIKPIELKQVMTKWQKGLEGKGWNSLYLSNHDQPRLLSRFGDDKNYPVESAKALATMLHTLQGTPYVYQGEEIGMSNPYFNRPEQYKDVETLNMLKEYEQKHGKTFEDMLPAIHLVGRDNARTPMQWDSSQYAGFSMVEPWLDVNKNYVSINVASQQNVEESVFSYYKKLISLRKEHEVIVYGSYFTEYLSEHESLYIYTRKHEDKTLIVIINLSSNTINCELPTEIKSLISNSENIICNYKHINLLNFPPFFAAAYLS